MDRFASRRAILQGAVAAVTIAGKRPVAAQMPAPAFSLPIGLPGRVLGDGFIVRHGYATENTWYNPGWLHTAEDWYLTDADTAAARVYAVADGEVVFAGSEYPGLVVIVRHAGELFSMYGHLDYALAVGTGNTVERGELIGTVLDRADGRAPSHLHFEMRTFLTAPEINGTEPRYDYGCGYDCPPGPGYWPIDAPEHPSVMGWLNPTHTIAGRAYAGEPPPGTEVVVSSTAGEPAVLWSAPADTDGARAVGEIVLTEGDRYRLLAIDAGRAATRETSAGSYHLWYRIAERDDARGWVQAAVPSTNDTGSDGRPSSVRFDFLPAIMAAE